MYILVQLVHVHVHASSFCMDNMYIWICTCIIHVGMMASTLTGLPESVPFMVYGIYMHMPRINDF